MIRKSKTGDFWILERDQFISKWAEESGTLAHDQSALPRILEHIPKDGCVVDCGAGIGSHSVRYLEAVGPLGCVYSFEPHPWSYRALVRNCPEARTYQLALGDQYRRTELFLDETNPGASYIWHDKDCSHLNCQPVFQVPLDELRLDRLDLCKLDCEGFELRVIYGAANTIERCHPVIVAEVNEHALKRAGTSPEELILYIRGLGYTARNLYKGEKMEGPQFDALFLPI